MNRRQILAGLAVSALPACARVAPTAAITPGSALWLRRDERDIIKAFSAISPRSQFRAASISKLAVAGLAEDLAAQGRLDLSADIAPRLGIPFRHPGFPDTPITLTHLLSHRAGLIDPAKYWVAAPGDIRSILMPDIFAPNIFAPDAEPGRFFRYSNLGYGIAATLMEAATGERFDRLVRAVLPKGAGFNWSGADPALAAPLYRGAPGAWEAQIDSPPIDPPTFVTTPGLNRADYLADYIPGTNGSLFSPQGGLRASFAQLMAFAETLPADDPVLWDAATDPGDTADDHFQQFGFGRYHYPPDRSPLPGIRLVGHAGEAYGFYGGLWRAPDIGAVMAFGTLGSPHDGVPMSGTRPNLRTTTARFFDRIARALA